MALLMAFTAGVAKHGASSTERDDQMRWQALVRTQLKRMLGIRSHAVLERKLPPLNEMFQRIDELGLYLHIPFCRQICPYCPYNKTVYRPELAKAYAQAVQREIELYSRLVGDRPITSFYIGGGTPTTMLQSGLPTILESIGRSFNMHCGIHMESHPIDLSAQNITAIKTLGVNHLSIGVEALHDHHLRLLHRPYNVAQARAAVERAVHAGFTCVNADMIFALPGQEYREVEEAGTRLLDWGVDQIAAYPLFTFPYTDWSHLSSRATAQVNVFHRRKMLSILEAMFYGAGFRRTSVWAFTRHDVPKYCSVTVPVYLGLGASGSSYLRDVFYVNTFSVPEYVRALEDRRLPIALSLTLSESMQMAGWLYWRIYETRFRASDFRKRFGRELDSVYSPWLGLMKSLGLLCRVADEFVLSDRGAYWLHTLQDLFSIDYISKLWGTSSTDPWPLKITL
jgi:coproporphyrinogen III oxidase-like Fe-S oxidoreductase